MSKRSTFRNNSRTFDYTRQYPVKPGHATYASPASERMSSVSLKRILDHHMTPWPLTELGKRIGRLQTRLCLERDDEARNSLVIMRGSHARHNSSSNSPCSPVLLASPRCTGSHVRSDRSCSRAAGYIICHTRDVSPPPTIISTIHNQLSDDIRTQYYNHFDKSLIDLAPTSIQVSLTVTSLEVMADEAGCTCATQS